MIQIDKVEYGGWPNCYRISNGIIEMVVPADIGIRVMRCGFTGGQNLLKEFPEQMGKSGEAEWQLRGGHRLWIGPEDGRYTYGLDNSPVDVRIDGEVLTVTQPVEPETGIEKSLEIRMDPGVAKATMIHRFRNRNLLPVEFAPWAPSVMAPGGVGITGFPPRGTHPEMLAPTNPLVMWAYTDWSDPRWIFLKKYLGLRQDPQASSPQKTGLFNPKTFGAYLLNGELFLKQYTADPGRTYPEYSCSFQTFTNQDFLELETFGPMTRLLHGETAELVERWSLHRAVALSAWTDAEVDRVLLPLLD
jgi:hypothetical protein